MIENGNGKGETSEALLSIKKETVKIIDRMRSKMAGTGSCLSILEMCGMPHVEAADGPLMVQGVKQLHDLSRLPDVVPLHHGEKNFASIETMDKINELYSQGATPFA